MIISVGVPSGSKIETIQHYVADLSQKTLESVVNDFETTHGVVLWIAAENGKLLFRGMAEASELDGRI